MHIGIQKEEFEEMYIRLQKVTDPAFDLSRALSRSKRAWMRACARGGEMQKNNLRDELILFARTVYEQYQNIEIWFR